MKKNAKRVISLIRKAPLLSFLVLLALLLGVIALGNSMRAPEVADDTQKTILKQVPTFTVGDTAFTEASGRVEKNDVVTVTAQVSGIVYRVNTVTGADVAQGKGLFTLSETYGGANAASVAARIAARNVQNQNETFAKNTDIADIQRDDFKGNDTNDSVARKQFTVTKRNLEAARDIAVLEQQQAAVNAARFFPTSPISGTVERIFVRPGQTVNAGEPLATLRGSGTDTKITVEVSRAIAEVVSVVHKAKIYTSDTEMIDAFPVHISQAPTNAQSYSITFVVDDSEGKLAHDDFVRVALPLENDGTILVPLDALQITNTGAILFVYENGVAQSRTVTLGDVVGAHVEVVSGLSRGERVVTERTVFDGEAIETR